MRIHATCRLTIVLLLCGGFTWFGIAANQNAAPKPTAEYYFHHDHVIGTSLDLWITANDEASADAAERAILDEIERLRRIFSTYDETSEISRLNRMRNPMVVSSDMIDVLKQYE